ncbi:MAG: Ig-like domain-containing protein [Candidatus Bipolaricaulota bacterium]|nr:Ig-like domain-containing protein [Candidatus Bipolaricaulota bacterium]
MHSIRRIRLVLVFLVFIGIAGLAYPPVALDSLVTTLRDIPVEIVLVATDEAIDPDHPEVHPLTFAILTPPSHGTLSGDLKAVVYEKYEPTNRALVKLIYNPERGYVGGDTLIFTVTDPFGFFATGTIRIDIARPPAPPPTLSGFIDGAFTITSAGITGFSTNLSLFCVVDIFRFEMHSSFGQAGWSSLSFVGSFPLATAAKVRSILAFDPAGPAFSYWQTSVYATWEGLDLDCTFNLGQTCSASYTQLTTRTRVGTALVTTWLKFGLCTVEFQEFRLTAYFTGPCCGFSVSSDLYFKKAGFDYLSFTVSRIPLSVFCCPSLPLYLNTTVEFTTDAKELDFDFVLDSLWQCCARLFAEVVSTGATIAGLNVYGVEFRLTLPTGIQLWTKSSFDPNKNSSVTGYQEYFEMFMLTGPIISCCGAPGRWQIFVYFQEHGALFGWGQTRIVLEYSLATTMRASLDYWIKNDGNWELKPGLKIAW